MTVAVEGLDAKLTLQIMQLFSKLSAFAKTVSLTSLVSELHKLSVIKLSIVITLMNSSADAQNPADVLFCGVCITI